MSVSFKGSLVLYEMVNVNNFMAKYTHPKSSLF